MNVKIRLIAIFFLLSVNVLKAQDIALDLGGELTGTDASQFPVGAAAAYFKLIVTNNGPGNLPAYKIRPQISLPTGALTFSTIASDHVLPNGWTILSNNGQTITLSNGTDQLADGDGHIILLKVNPLIVGSYISVANLLFSNGVAPGSSNGPQLPGDDGTNQGLPFAYSVTPPLPVTLISFNAIRENTAANLTWSTTEETNSDRFDIQHSTNAKQWETIGSVASHGESRITRDYSFSHKTPVAGNNYYRLKMIDKDGTFAYSPIRSLKFEADLKAEVYPNPVAETLLIDSNDWNNVSNVQLVNTSGVAVYNSGTSPSQTVDVKKLNAGIYFVKITKQNGTQINKKIAIAR